MQNIDDYIASHISAEPSLLKKTYRQTHLHHLYPRMCSGHVQGRLLKMITTMVNPRKVIELGAFTGYSTLCIAEGMAEDGELHAVELDDELGDELQERFEESGFGERIHLHIGDAIEIIPQLDEHGPWDMAFIDANKRHYLQYYNLLLPRMRHGGFIIADNTLWDGKVIEQPAPKDAQTRGIMAFNDFVAADERVEVSMVPVRDGLTLIRVI